MALSLRLRTAARSKVRGGIKFARLLELPESEVERQMLEIEGTEQFRLLRDAGVLEVHSYPRARFDARRLAGRELRAVGSPPEILDGEGNLARLLRRIGQERFEEWFLRDDPFSDEERASGCGISLEEVRNLRDLVNRLYVQAEFEDPEGRLPPPKVYSVVAHIEIEDGRPILAFFHREIWKGRYQLDERKWTALAETMPSRRVREIESLLSRLRWIERRKSTLHQVLEALIEVQANYLITGDPQRRRPLTQRALAAQLGISPSLLNSLAMTKAVRLPWGAEASIKVLMPSSKTLLLGRLFDLAVAKPALSDAGLVEELNRTHGLNLSRRSVAQYRSDLKIGGQGRRAALQGVAA